jgi:flagellar capping protein FliD
MTNSEYQQLIEFLGRQFTEIDRRFTSIDQRFVSIDQRLDAMEQRFDAQFREILGHFDQLYQRLERLEQEYHAILLALRRIETLLVDETGKREVIERSIDELKRHVAALQSRIEELERRIRA